jgi:hypothetical protein
MNKVARALCVLFLSGCEAVPSSQAQPSRTATPALEPVAAPSPSPGSATANWAAVDALLKTAAYDSAFKALNLLDADLNRKGVAAEAFCYEALAFFSLNQIGAGSVESKRCLSRLAPEQRASWKARLEKADAAGNARVTKIVAQAAAEKCTLALSVGTGVGTCKDCVRAGDVKTRLDRLKDAETPASSALKGKLSPRDSSEVAPGHTASANPRVRPGSQLEGTE